MNDAEARDYAIRAFEGFARELEGALVHSRELDAGDFIDRMRTVAGRLDSERLEADRIAELADVVDGLVELTGRLEERVDYLGRRVLGGVPRGGLVVAGPTYDAALIVENVRRARAGEPLLSNLTAFD